VFENLTERLDEIFKQLRRRGKLSEADVDLAMREVRLALLDADVNYGVVKDFITRVRTRAIGVEVSKALNPAQQVIKIVNEELIITLGEPERLNLSGPRPRVLMLVGLQGSGKTTFAGKLAQVLRSQGERVMLVAADPYRPAAVKQLQTLGERLNVPVHYEAGLKPPELAAQAYDKAQKGNFTILILDTAGRSQLDQALMDELIAINKRVGPVEILLVVINGRSGSGQRQRVPGGHSAHRLDPDENGWRCAWGSHFDTICHRVPIKYLGTAKPDAIEA
jgi:signal recognition particle subunit SRP54